MTNPLDSTILVTGAGGHLGARIVELLRAGGARHVIGGSRNPEKLSGDARKVDFEDAATLDAAFSGVDQLLIISTDVFGAARQRQHLAAVAAAKKAGVKHIVYTSLTNPGPGSPVVLAPDHDATETAIKATGAAYTIIRNSVYMEQLLGALPQAIISGTWFTATGQGRIANISREDCARIAAAVLLAGPKGNRVIDATGPELLSTEEIAAIATELTGRPIKVVHLDDAAMSAGLVGAGLPPPIADLIVSFDAGVRAGTFAVLTGAVQELTGTPPVSIRDFLAANRSVLAG